MEEEDPHRSDSEGKGAAGPGDDERVRITPKVGRVLLHWHGMSGGGCLLHEGEEVLGGDKWVMRMDVLGDKM